MPDTIRIFDKSATSVATCAPPSPSPTAFDPQQPHAASAPADDRKGPADDQKKLADLHEQIAELERRWSEKAVSFVGAALVAGPLAAEVFAPGDALTNLEYVATTIAGFALSAAGIVAGDRLRVYRWALRAKAEQLQKQPSLMAERTHEDVAS